MFACISSFNLYAAAAKSLQSCPTVCDPMDGSPPGSPVPEILQARTLEWVAISFSNAWKWKVNVNSLSRVWLIVTPWTVAYQAPPSMGFSRQEYWSGVPLPSPNLYEAGAVNQSICQIRKLRQRGNVTCQPTNYSLNMNRNLGYFPTSDIFLGTRKFAN